MSSLFLNAFVDGALTNSLGRLFQRFAILFPKNFTLQSTLHFSFLILNMLNPWSLVAVCWLVCWLVGKNIAIVRLKAITREWLRSWQVTGCCVYLFFVPVVLSAPLSCMLPWWSGSHQQSECLALLSGCAWEKPSSESLCYVPALSLCYYQAPYTQASLPQCLLLLGPLVHQRPTWNNILRFSECLNVEAAHVCLVCKNPTGAPLRACQIIQVYMYSAV